MSCGDKPIPVSLNNSILGIWMHNVRLRQLWMTDWISNFNQTSPKSQTFVRSKEHITLTTWIAKIDVSKNSSRSSVSITTSCHREFHGVTNQIHDDFERAGTLAKTREARGLICTHLDECGQDQRAALMDIVIAEFWVG